MRPRIKSAVVVALVFSLAGFGAFSLHKVLEAHELYEIAEHDEHGNKHRNRGGRSSSSSVPRNDAYAAACASCHMLYPPQLLPAQSWKTLLAQADNHFGQTVPLGVAEKNAITAYLEANDAFSSSSKQARKIAKHLGSSTPLRISELQYIQHKHRKLDSAVFKRPSIGSLANCKACHPGAEAGDFEDDNVAIPAN